MYLLDTYPTRLSFVFTLYHPLSAIFIRYTSSFTFNIETTLFASVFGSFRIFSLVQLNTLPLAATTYSPEIYPLSVLYQLFDVFAINCTNLPFTYEPSLAEEEFGAERMLRLSDCVLIFPRSSTGVSEIMVVDVVGVLDEVLISP